VPGATRDVYDQYVAEVKKQNGPTENIQFASASWRRDGLRRISNSSHPR
jgi:hypothetical protein